MAFDDLPEHEKELIRQGERRQHEENMRNPEFRRGWDHMTDLHQRAAERDAAVARAERAEAERDQLTYERRLLGVARMVLDLVAADTPDRWDEARGQAENVAQRIVDEIGHPVTDEPALGPHYREQLQRAQAALADAQQSATLLQILVEFLGLFERLDLQDQIFWRTGDGGSVAFYANVSDVFAWGAADAEHIGIADGGALQRAYDDLVAIDAEEFTLELFAARKRKMRPQNAAYPDNPDAAALFDECGPDRATDPCNVGNRP